MSLLAQFIVYAFLFSDVFRLSAVFGVSSQMHAKLYFSALASVVAFTVAFLLLVKSRSKPPGTRTFLYLSTAAFAGGVSTVTPAIASYLYITYPSIFFTDITFVLYRIHFVSLPLIVLFFWLFFAQITMLKRSIVYFIAAASVLVTFLNLIAPITQEEVQLTLSVNMDIAFSLILLALWIGVFLSIAISFYYYATKQEGERRLMGFLAGTAALFAVMIQVTNLFAFIFGNPVLEASVWICAAAAFILMYFALLPPKRLIPG